MGQVHSNFPVGPGAVGAMGAAAGIAGAAASAGARNFCGSAWKRFTQLWLQK
jgi:hypothetical protein